MSLFLDVASGGTLDWYYDEFGIINSICFECRGPQNGISETEIIPNSEEIYEAIKAASFAYLDMKK